MKRHIGTFILVGLCLCVLVLAVTSMRKKSLTFDEVAYIPAGYSYLTTCDFRLNQGHPPLTKLLAGIPLLFLHPELPTDHPSWAEAGQGSNHAHWSFGLEFLNRADNEVETLAFWARLPTVFLALLLVLGVYLFARDLYGRTAGYVAATLCAFSPNILAHARLATTDLGLACFVLLSVYTFYRFTRKPTAVNLTLAGICYGLALLTKYSALFIAPLFLLWAVLLPVLRNGVEVPSSAWGRLAEGPRRNRLLFLGSSVVILVVIAAVVASLGYLTPGRFDIYLRNVQMISIGNNTDYLAYLNGAFSTDRFPHYFVIAFLVKTPLAFLILLALRIVAHFHHREESLAAKVLLLTPVAIFLIIISLKAFQIGLRYILPIYPLLFVFTAGLVRSPLFRNIPMRIVTGTLIAWFVIASLSAYPNYLSYFNEVAGGPNRGIEWLDDSNIDWGQDLIQLRDYMEDQEIQEVKLTHMAWYDPALYGIDAEWLHAADMFNRLSQPNPPPGTYVVSVHVLNRAQFYETATVNPLTDLTPATIIGHTLYVYRF